MSPWLARQAEAREGRYAAVADLVIDVDDLTVEATAERILVIPSHGLNPAAGGRVRSLAVEPLGSIGRSRA